MNKERRDEFRVFLTERKNSMRIEAVPGVFTGFDILELLGAADELEELRSELTILMYEWDSMRSHSDAAKNAYHDAVSSIAHLLLKDKP